MMDTNRAGLDECIEKIKKMKTMELNDTGSEEKSRYDRGRSYEMVLRMMGLIFILVAAIVAAINKDT